MRDEIESDRWTSRPLLSRLTRVLVFLGPVASSFAAAVLARGLLPPVHGWLDRAAALAVLAGVSVLTLWLVDRVARRLLPLVVLLDLSMLFPDRAPSRLRVARDAIRNRPIQEQLARISRAGGDPGAVAAEILTLVAALSRHDRPTRGHAERVRMFTDLVAEQMRVPRRDRDLLRWAAILHDIGKLRVPTELLNKPGKPTDQEWEVLRSHPAFGAEIAQALVPWLGEWGAVIVQHHERYDGTGYPSGLAAGRISVGARIVAVADAFDVMTAARAYKRPVSRRAALQELVRFSGTQFDPAAVRAMVDVGAPRLRRVQGLTAMLSDVPLVASNAVPAATLARVVGAGALAAGAVTAGGVATAAPPPATSTSIPLPGQRTASAPDDVTLTGYETSTALRGADLSAADLPRPSDRRPASATATRGTSGGTTSGSTGGAGGSGGGSGGSGGSGGGTLPGQPVRTVTSTVGAAAGTVRAATDTVKAAVKGTVKGTVGGAAGAAGSAAGTVGGTVGGAAGAAAGAAGAVTVPVPVPAPAPVPTVPAPDQIVAGLIGAPKAPKGP